MTITRHNIFPTPLLHIQGAPQQLVDKLYKKALELKQSYKDNGLRRSNQGGFQTTQINWEEFHPEGIEYINKIISETFYDVPDWKILGWWYNINPKGSWNIAHTHRGCDLVLIWYLTDSYGTLNLINPSKIKGEQNLNLNSNKGDIIIFPGDIVHYVMPNPKETDRVCISMNLKL